MLIHFLFIGILILYAVQNKIHGERNVSFEIVDLQCDCFVVSADNGGEKLGMTWIQYRHLEKFGIDLIGCDNGVKCNAGVGDTDCNIHLPVICTKTDYSPRPPYVVTGNGHAMGPE